MLLLQDEVMTNADSSIHGRRGILRIRPNIFLISSSLLLIPALLWLLPTVVDCVRSTDGMTRQAGLASLTNVVAAQGKRPFTFEDMMKLKRIGEPVPSPDGKWVLFSAVDVDLAANKKTPHIWIVPLGGTTSVDTGANDIRQRERILIPNQDGDRPRWAPDGKRFAFISTKDHGSQVWIANFDGAAGAVTSVHQRTAIATEAAGELWSPDGKTIIFTSEVYPECDGTPGEEEPCNSKKAKEAQEVKVKALVFDRLLYRHWNAYKAGTRTHILAINADQVKPHIDSIWDLTPGDYDAPVFSLGGQDNYAFSPDGQEICYTSNHDKVEATSTNNDLWTVPVNWPVNATPADVLAKTKNITADNPASDSTPLYSPDGKYIAYRAQQRPGYESDRFRLMLRNRKTGEKRDIITEHFDHWVGSFGWAARYEIVFTAEDEGESPIYYVIPKGCPDEGCYPIKILDGFNDDIAAGEKTAVAKEVPDMLELIVFRRMSLQAPAEIVVADSGTYAVGLERVQVELEG
jgi:dipeptidyl aminopeptidase/acylaminoacyl peptidase